MEPYRATQVQTDEQLHEFCQSPSLPALNPAVIRQHEADAHWLVTGPGGAVEARGSLWWSRVPGYPGQRLGVIGHYAARSAASGAQLLQHACRQLADQGCTMAVGPMDGNTWRSYRLVIEPGAEPAFFLEPQNPADWPDHFIQDGFTIMARYDSRLDDNLRQLPDLGRVASRLAQLGFTIRPFRADRITQELGLIFDLSLASFRQNFLYTPISLAEFMAIYAPLQPYIKPELIFIAEHNGMAIGFIFALPDVLQAQRNETTDTVIIKTVAVHPQYRIGGIGSLLVTRCRETACRLGYRRAIHALMFEGNVSRKMSRRNQSTLLRRYALFSKGL